MVCGIIFHTWRSRERLGNIFSCPSNSVLVIHSVLVTVSCTHSDPVLCLQQLSRGLALPRPQAMAIISGLSTYTVLFSLYLSTLHDAEFYRENQGMQPDLPSDGLTRCLTPPSPPLPTPVPVSSQIPFSLSELTVMVTAFRDVFITLHLERHLPPTYTLSQQTVTPDTKPHPQVCCPSPSPLTPDL